MNENAEKKNKVYGVREKKFDCNEVEILSFVSPMSATGNRFSKPDRGERESFRAVIPLGNGWPQQHQREPWKDERKEI